MFYLLLSLTLSFGCSSCGSCKNQPENLTQIFSGSWNISSFEYDENAIETVGKVYPITLKPIENGNLMGELMGEDEDGVSIPITQVKIIFDEINRNKFTVFQLENEEFKEYTTLNVQCGLDGGRTVTGIIDEDSILSASIINSINIHITLFDQKSKKTSVLRLKKPQPEQKQNLFATFLPMILMVAIQFFMKGKGGCPGGCAGGECQRPQTEAPKEKTE